MLISIHALREEGDVRLEAPPAAHPYFYPRPPRGGRPDHHKDDSQPFRISIHALREEGDS